MEWFVRRETPLESESRYNKKKSDYKELFFVSVPGMLQGLSKYWEKKTPERSKLYTLTIKETLIVLK